jgi:hypothetical protein
VADPRPAGLEFLEDRCVHGPGDLKGKPYTLDDDKRAFLYRMYEVFPKSTRGRGSAGSSGASCRCGRGRRRPSSPARSRSPSCTRGPVRTTGGGAGTLWEPVGGPVTDPYMPMVAYTEEQTEDLAYAALYVMCSEGEDADLFDIGLDRIIRLDDRGRADGKAVALASAPDSRDGARTTFQHFDEPHRFTLPRLVEAHETMLQNIPKRPIADPWSLETSTTYTPGEGSVLEATHEQADLVAQGKASIPDVLLLPPRGDAGDGEDLDDPKQLRAAIREASGPAIATWEDFEGQVESIATLYSQAKQRGNQWYFERVWLNRRRQSGRQAFDATVGRAVRNDGFVIPDKDPVVVGFDGSRWRDATALVLTTVEGFQHAFGCGNTTARGWEVPEGEVDAAVEEIARRWKLIRLYGDPAQGWDVALARWAGKYGRRRSPCSTPTPVTSAGPAPRSGPTTRRSAAGTFPTTATSDDGRAHRQRLQAGCRPSMRTAAAVDDREGTPRLTEEDRLCDGRRLSWQARLDAIAAKELRRIKRTLVVQ